MSKLTLRDVLDDLSKPFPPELVHLKVQALSKDETYGLVVPYVDVREVLDTLDRVVGPDNWHDEYIVLSDRREKGGLVEVKCRLTVLGITKEDVGEGDTLKAAFTDALKRAAVKFGVGRYLYRTNPRWVALGPKGEIPDYDQVKAAILGVSPESPKEASPPPPKPEAITKEQLEAISKIMAQKGLSPDKVRTLAKEFVGRGIKSAMDLTQEEAEAFIEFLEEYDPKAEEIF